MDPKEARELSIKLCSVTYEEIKKIPRSSRSRISEITPTDVLWTADLIAFSALERYLKNIDLPFTLITESRRIENENAQIIIVADELEGTRNFKDGNGPFAVSICIFDTKSSNILGAAVLVQDSWGVRIYSADDKYAYKEDYKRNERKRIKCTNKKLENCSIAVGDYHTSLSDARLLPLMALYNTREKKPLNPLTETITGSYASAIDICYCADPQIGVVGYIDLRGLWSNESKFPKHGIRAFDVIPSVHILECAGGKATDVFGHKLNYDFKCETILTMIAGSNAEIHRELFERVRESLKMMRYL
jgi:fructose-1,6-bisphosphatase/inositol monophosphatase family enzyme